MVKFTWSDLPWWAQTLVVLHFLTLLSLLFFNLLGFVIGFIEGFFLL